MRRLIVEIEVDGYDYNTDDQIVLLLNKALEVRDEEIGLAIIALIPKGKAT